MVIEDQLLKGAKIACETSYAPSSGKKTGRLKAGYKAAHINSNLGMLSIPLHLVIRALLSNKRNFLSPSPDVDFNYAGPTVNAAAVLGHSGVFAGFFSFALSL